MISPTDPSSNLAIDSKGLESLKQSARQNSPDALKVAAKQFEALFMNMVMKSMREATPKDELFDNDQTRMYTSMLDQQLSQNMAGRGLGLADMLVKQLSSSMNGQTLPGQPSAAASPGVSAAVERAMGKKNPWASTVPSADEGRGVGEQPAHVRAFQERLGAAAAEASDSTGIPAKFMLGQAALESDWGRREIRAADGNQSFNVFGIKAGGGWKGKTVDVVTTEYTNGVAQKQVQKFRAYDSYADAFRDYAALLKNNPRYQDVLANGQSVQGFAYGLQRAGYATDPNYGSKLTTIITKNLSV